ncbi:MAG TPA: LysM domain-containing protein [Phycisphaerae bacterium]|nr:LysM domain-containing protein [Phycisphaerae bacterium]HNU45584.1 LysM domain-containing protein [Phycisphaerae bacterium]
MARETKVGLLVGLAFIICFAVILANHGRQDGLQTQVPFTFVVDPRGHASGNSTDSAGIPAGTGIPASSVPTSRMLVRGPQPAGPAGLPEAAHSGRTAGNAEMPVGMPAGAEAVTGAPGDGWVRGEGAADGQGRSLGDRLRSLQALLDARHSSMAGTGHNSQADAGAATAAGVPAMPDRQSPSGTPLTATAQPVVTGPATGWRLEPGPPAASEPPAVTSAGVRYVVAPQDTLSRIARAYYGTASYQVIGQIYAANKNTLKDRDTLRVGDELILPVIPGLPGSQGGQTGGAGPAGPPTAPATREAPAPDRTPATRPPAGSPAGAAERSARPAATAPPTPPPVAEASAIRWYQVKKNDRYVSIAREQLGNERRWKEIYELNKDKFPDAGHIREGVRIKLPPK